ncbi:hypothetical protein TSUD_122310 [Trifolium subterraneum]|nr:hypothetical protein TSUD_122310 [Trifolium subterraneum]
MGTPRRLQLEILIRRVDSCKSNFSSLFDIVYGGGDKKEPKVPKDGDGGDGGGGGDGGDVKKGPMGGGVKKTYPMFKDLAGDVMEKIKNNLEIPLTLMCQPKLCREFGLKPISGILLHGPPGCGKTRLAQAIANEVDVPFYPISATEVFDSYVGESEKNIRALFSKAKKTSPSIISIDEIDAIAMKRSEHSPHYDRGALTQLLTCMDESCSSSGSSDEPNGHVLVIGTTNRIDDIDPAFRRPGRFTLEIDVGIPDESARVAILFYHTRNCRDKLDSSVDLQKIARSTPGFVGADLEALVVKAGELALDRIINERKHKFSITNAGRWKNPWSPQEINKFVIKMTDFEEALKVAQPSLTREGFSPVPDVKWEAVGALDHVREEFDQHIVKHIKDPDIYEVDAMTATEHENEGGRVIDGIRKQLQIELDGTEQRKGVFVIGATNRPEVIDGALLRPGRFGNHIYIPVPSPDGRVSILKALAMHKEALARRNENRARFKLMPIDASVDLSSIARLKACENFSAKGEL